MPVLGSRPWVEGGRASGGELEVQQPVEGPPGVVGIETEVIGNAGHPLTMSRVVGGEPPAPDAFDEWIGGTWRSGVTVHRLAGGRKRSADLALRSSGPQMADGEEVPGLSTGEDR